VWMSTIAGTLLQPHLDPHLLLTGGWAVVWQPLGSDGAYLFTHPPCSQ